MKLTAKIILKEYKLGIINLFEATEKLRQINISQKKSKKILMNINRKNIFLISDYLGGSIGNRDYDCLFEINYHDLDENQDEEYYFEIDYED